MSRERCAKGGGDYLVYEIGVIDPLDALERAPVAAEAGAGHALYMYGEFLVQCGNPVLGGGIGEEGVKGVCSVAGSGFVETEEDEAALGVLYADYVRRCLVEEGRGLYPR